MTGPVPIRPDWPAPTHVGAASTTRAGGVSPAPFDSLNLGATAGDDPDNVAANRRRLREALGLPGEPAWLRQVHGSRVVKLENFPSLENEGAETGGDEMPEADATWTDRPGVVCAILSADCLPILLCDDKGTRVGAVHGGWRGLADGVLPNAIEAMGGKPASLHAWLGPAIGPQRFEIGPEVRQRLMGGGRAPAEAFRPSDRRDHWLCDLYAVARHQLATAGLESVHGGGFCTVTERDRFFSYRRDGRTGRMATIIWME